MLSATLEFCQLWLRRCLAPSTCELCETLVVHPPDLCSTCEAGLKTLRREHCSCCALPFSAGSRDGHLCEDCLGQPPSFQKVSAAFEFAGSAEALLHALKFGRRLPLLPALTRRALLSFREAVQSFRPHALLPVPLGRWRRFRRGFNQSHALAAELNRVSGSGIPLVSGVHRRQASPQARKDRAERLRAMAGAFAVEKPQFFRKQRVLVLDDVMTTGATVESLGKSLLQAGAEAVQVYVLARTARKEHL